MQKITTFLWFDNQAEEAAKFYCSIFKNAKITRTSHYGEGAPRPKGSVMVVAFQIEGQDFLALNGGPGHPFTDAISLMVNCESQAEVDAYYDGLVSNGGKEIMCGWLADKYGLCWQITPVALMKLMSDPNPKRAQAAMQAMMKMKKIDIAELQRAADAA